MPDTTERFFVPAPDSVRRARGFAVRTLADWGLEERADDVRLCVSELATNAVEHGTGCCHGFSVTMTAEDDAVRVEVHHHGHRRPRLRHPTDDEVSGRGLRIVDMLSDDWGWEERGGAGKVVWSLFKTAPANQGKTS
ncbi:ATP-binding protein [Streptomyces sp. ID38640]|uniref:ATP-binding protein n=1 Tax=Streptomyces sp. ID38640 TaxID=1265399 RepID=UPI00140F2982|nr:ATP-binding protein [Streptomyces sp. ID38640]QIK08178.1 ATP-binding protein [Streptomyces sp. ID38640]